MVFILYLVHGRFSVHRTAAAPQCAYKLPALQLLEDCRAPNAISIWHAVVEELGAAAFLYVRIHARTHAPN